MIVRLSRPFVPRSQIPVVHSIDTRLFTEKFFSACMACDFCHDSCCQYGATVEVPKMEALLACKDALEPFVGRPASDWFDGEFREDYEYPGGRYTRTRVFDNRCVFLNRDGRGCLLHSYALQHNLPVHELKPLACTLFPIWWMHGVMVLPPEIEDGELVCLGEGETLYRSARNDLLLHYGPELVAELDALEAAEVAKGPRERRIPLPSV
jgi:Fe-S-cluster containining protein